jgi:hypothetical protein
MLGDDIMVTITLQADAALIDDLAEIADAKQISLEEAAREALARYVVGEQAIGKQRYSFIGIGHSGKGDLSQRVDEILAASSERREGWSLDR